MPFIRKNKGGISHLKSNLNTKNINVYFNKKLISYYMIFETNKYIYRYGYLLGCKSETRQRKN